MNPSSRSLRFARAATGLGGRAARRVRRCRSGRGHSSADARTSGPGPCPLITKLDTIAARVARADVSDPDRFKRTLDGAVDEYATTVASLRSRVPATIRPDLDRVASDVRQYRFDAARTDRAALDEYARTACGRVSSPTTIG